MWTHSSSCRAGFDWLESSGCTLSERASNAGPVQLKLASRVDPSVDCGKLGLIGPKHVAVCTCNSNEVDSKVDPSVDLFVAWLIGPNVLQIWRLTNYISTESSLNS